jgi:endoglucanase
MRLLFLTAMVLLLSFRNGGGETSWIRINLLGYKPSGIKVAVWCSKDNEDIKTFRLIEASSGKTVLTGAAGKPFGAYGPFTQSYRLNFTNFQKPGKYYLAAGNARSPEFSIGDGVYDGTADFCLRYMRQQRCGFNPFLKDSCHTHDGYTVYGPPAGAHSNEKEGMRTDAVGGWHDASDYLQYATTSANAAYHLMMAYRDFGSVFTDRHDANGLQGSNGLADVMDEAQWGIDWLVKMHPRKDWMFNQIADDRDHMGMRIPKEDTFYNRGFERPVYFITGEPQGLFRYKNRTTGTSSTAAKFASCFALAHYLYLTDSAYTKAAKSQHYLDKAVDAYQYALKKPGVTQTAPGRAPYFYEEDNWVDDMELASAAIFEAVNNHVGGGDARYYLLEGFSYANKEPITPWLGQDTARHYQWYPFINIGHYELVRAPKWRKAPRSASRKLLGYYKQGIGRVWGKAKENAFLRGVPFIWCSNNLTVSFATQCYWYRQLSGDRRYEELEQANFDWIFGCNPWGTSMVYGLPAWGDTPSDPHSAFTHLKNYPIDGGLVDGPVYGSIYKNLIGIKLYQPDEYAAFQSDLVVYHDDYGDYSTNEPTMDGTASLIYLLAAKEAEGRTVKKKR